MSEETENKELHSPVESVVGGFFYGEIKEEDVFPYPQFLRNNKILLAK